MATGSNARIRAIPIVPKDADVDVEGIRRDLKIVVRTTTAEGHRYVSTYPPQTLTSSGYVRTGTLKRSWSHRMSVGLSELTAVVGSNSNIAPYNLWVQGRRPARIFKGTGWRGVDDLGNFLQDKLEREVGTLIERVADR